MKKTISVASGHTLFVRSIYKSDLPKGMDHVADFETFYVVKNFGEEGKTFMYLGKGHRQAPNQIVVWYANGLGFWSSYGKNIKDAIEGAQKDGWLYA